MTKCTAEPFALYCECEANDPDCHYDEASRAASRHGWAEIEASGRAALERLERF